MYPSLGTPSLGLGVRLGFTFSMLLASVVQPDTHLCVSVMLQGADESGGPIAIKTRLHGFIVQRTMN